MKCPDCENGTVVGLFARMADGSCKPRVVIPCPRCKGACVVPDEMPEWIAAGKELRDIRLAMNLGLRKAAEAIGVLPSDLSFAEQGLERHSAALMKKRLLALRAMEAAR